MEPVLGCLLLLFAVGMLMAVFVRRARPVTTVLIAILIYVPSYFVCFALQYLSVVPVDSLLRGPRASTPTNSSAHRLAR